MRGWIAASTAVVLFGFGACAQQSEQAAAVKVACKSDIQTYCSSTEPRTPERKLCLKDNASKFTKECQEALKNLADSQEKK